MFSRCPYALCFLLLLMAACTQPEKQRVMETSRPVPVPKFSQEYIARLDALCYARIQNAVGETRKGRGIIWAECMYKNVRPVEQANYPLKAGEIDHMYQALLRDMKAFYNGQTTRELLHRRWIARQNAIGYEEIRTFQDSYS